MEGERKKLYYQVAGEKDVDYKYAMHELLRAVPKVNYHIRT